RQRDAALVAADTLGDVGQRRIGDVDGRVVERDLARGVVDRPRQRRLRGGGAGLDAALEALANAAGAGRPRADARDRDAAGRRAAAGHAVGTRAALQLAAAAVAHGAAVTAVHRRAGDRRAVGRRAHAGDAGRAAARTRRARAAVERAAAVVADHPAVAAVGR